MKLPIKQNGSVEEKLRVTNIPIILKF